MREVGRRLLITVLFCSSPCWALPLERQLTPKEIAQSFLPAALKIEATDANGNILREGSGFVVRQDGFILTNYHLIAGAHSADAVLRSGDRLAVLGVVQADEQRDFALLKIQAVDLPTVPMGNSDLVEVGDDVVALSVPLGLSGSLSSGTVSLIRQSQYCRVIQHSAGLSTESSGGPLITADGKAVGLNTFSTQGGKDFCYVIPCNYPRAALESFNGSLTPLARLGQSVSGQVSPLATNQEREATIVPRAKQLQSDFDNQIYKMEFDAQDLVIRKTVGISSPFLNLSPRRAHRFTRAH